MQNLGSIRQLGAELWANSHTKVSFAIPLLEAFQKQEFKRLLNSHFHTLFHLLCFLLVVLPLYFVHLYSVCGAGLGLKLPFEAELMIMREVIMDLYSFTTTLLLKVGDQIVAFTVFRS